MFAATLLLTLSTLLFRGAIAQSVSTGATCIDSFSWASNSLKQNPCLVAAYLLSPCSGGAYAVPPLVENTHYLGPDTLLSSNNCQCNTVTYSMLSACGLCQNRTAINWSTYSYQCKEVESSEYPLDIPDGTAVPGWAYIQLDQDNFNIAEAQNIANTTTEHKPPPPPASSSFSSSTSSAHSSVSSARSHSSKIPQSSSTHEFSSTTGSAQPSESGGTEQDTEPPSPKKGSRTDKIVGGILGGLLGLGLLVGLVLIAIKQRRRENSGLQSLSSSTANVSVQPETKQIPTPSVAAVV
jgi:hypothetical protein